MSPLYLAYLDSVGFQPCARKKMWSPSPIYLGGLPPPRQGPPGAWDPPHHELIGIQDLEGREEELLNIIRTQINRRHATPYHRVENALPLYEMEKAKAKDRMLRGNPRAKLPEGMTGRAREAIAKLVGLGDRTVEKALYIVEHSDVIEGLKDRLRWR